MAKTKEPTPPTRINAVPKHITIDEYKGTRTSGGVNFDDLLNLCLNSIVSMAIRIVIEALKEEDTEKVKQVMTEYLYDQMNAAFTRALQTFAPEIVAHPGLTELAIQKAEDEIINAYLASLTPEELAAAEEGVAQLRAESKRKLMQRIAERNALLQMQRDNFVPLTPEQDAALHTVVNEEATAEEIAAAEDYLKEHPLVFRDTPLEEEPINGVLQFSRTVKKEENTQNGSTDN